MSRELTHYAPLSDRTNEIRSMVSKLTVVMPYPLHWFDSKTDKQIIGMYNSKLGLMAKVAIMADEAIVREKLQRGLASSTKGGELHVVCVNKKSFRFKFTKGDCVRFGIVTKYYMKQYGGCRGGGDLGRGFVQVTWDNNKIAMYRVQTLISFAVDRVSNDTREFVQAIYTIDDASN